MQVLTDSEKLLLSAVGFFTIFLTVLVIVCLVRKSCWLYQAIWEDDKKKKSKMDDIICIKYPPDIYPTSLGGVFRDGAFRSPDEEMTRLFYANLKRDSTYSSMSEGSGSGSSNGTGSYDLASPRNSSESNTTAINSPIIGTSLSAQHSPTHRTQQPHQFTAVPTLPLPIISVPDQRRASMPHLSNGSRSAATALAEQVVHQRLSLQHGPSSVSASSLLNQRQPFFTFVLKYDGDKSLIHVDFIEARNLPPKEYLNQLSDAFFTVEILPRKPMDKKKETLRYRFVTKTIKKAGEVVDFSETFLAQLPKPQIKEYVIRFTAFDQDRFGNPTEIGSTTLAFDDFKDFVTNKLVLSCSLKEPGLKRGDIMLGMCYLPTAERMSVTVVKLNNLNPQLSEGRITKESICYVRLILLRGDSGKVIRKKKTTFQKLSGSNANQPFFNETIVFDMPPTELIQTVLLVLVCITDKPPLHRGSQSTNSSVEMDSSESRRQSLLQPKMSTDSVFHYAENLINKARRMDSKTSQSSQETRSLRSKISNESDRSISTMECINPLARGSCGVSPCGSASEHMEDEGEDTSVKPQRVRDTVIGKVALGYCIKNPMGKFHFESMMRTPRSVVTEWHSLK